MPIIAAGKTVNIPLQAGQDLLFDAVGQGQAVVADGQASGTSYTLGASPVRIGPFRSTRTISITAALPLSYSAGRITSNMDRVVADSSGTALTAPGLPLNAGRAYAGNLAIYGATRPASFIRSKAKKNAVAAGTDMMIALNMGDSTEAGSYGPGAGGLVGARLYCLAQQFANVITRPGLQAFSENWMGDGGAADVANTLTQYNPLVTLGSGWASDATITTLGGRPIKSTTASTSLTYSTWSECDTYVVYVRRQAGGGSITLSRAGDTSQGPISTAGAEGVIVLTFKGALATTAISIDHDATTNPVTVLGIDAYNSTIPQVRCISGAYAGSKVAQWADSTNPYSALNMMQLINPDLLELGPCINDWVAGTAIGNAATSGTVIGDLHKIIVAAKAQGTDVVVRSGVPSRITSATRATQKSYVDAIRDLCEVDGVVFQDTWTKWGPQEVNPLWYFNVLHPNATGYRVMAETYGAIFDMIG